MWDSTIHRTKKMMASKLNIRVVIRKRRKDTASVSKVRRWKQSGRKSRKIRGVTVLAVTLATSQMKMSSTIEMKSTTHRKRKSTRSALSSSTATMMKITDPMMTVMMTVPILIRTLKSEGKRSSENLNNLCLMMKKSLQPRMTRWSSAKRCTTRSWDNWEKISRVCIKDKKNSSARSSGNKKKEPNLWAINSFKSASASSFRRLHL